MAGFTPIRLIQPQTPDQQQAIQNLVDELRKASPQLFSNLGQTNGQQIAIALPSTTPNAPAASVAPAPHPQQPQTPQVPQVPQQQEQPQAPQTPALAVPPEAPAATSSAPAELFTETAPTPAVNEQASESSDSSTPVSFAVNAMFMSPDADEEATDEVSDDATIPFGLRFDPTFTESEGTDSEGSSIHHHHDSTSGSSSEDATDFDFFDDLSDLDSSATTRAAMSLAAIGLSLFASMAFWL
ncbi:hypothetical protein GGI11_007159 [Coemansia sp. RSA 2049]|nr:hypothetical protein GGI11_007159 [Coemansia sp. RSA 2049]KAJ2595722.1 hypothetical protein EV177_008078 [Coemansia sp. RSA 1804]KAJ2654387.1 hypothetical protein GGH99_007336 [Coemansia sp. RSA 1285]